MCVSVLFGTVLAITGAQAALATPPVTSSHVLQGSIALADCGSFQVIDNYDETVDITRYYDNTGTLTEVHLAINGTDTYTQSVTGQAISQPSHFMAHFDPQTGLNSSGGLQYRLMIPGLGHVLLDAGRTIYDAQTGELVFAAGPHQVADGDTSELCAAFA